MVDIATLNFSLAFFMILITFQAPLHSHPNNLYNRYSLSLFSIDSHAPPEPLTSPRLFYFCFEQSCGYKDDQRFIAVMLREETCLEFFPLCQQCVGRSNTCLWNGVSRFFFSLFPFPRLLQLRRNFKVWGKKNLSPKWISKDEPLICLNFACTVYFHITFSASLPNPVSFHALSRKRNLQCLWLGK